MKRRRRVLVPILVLLCPLLLVGGIYLGGHPQWLPDPARDVLVADTDARLYDETLDLIEDDYYREVDRDRLTNEALESAVESLDDRFSSYFSPRSYQRFQQTTSGRFVGIGVSVREDDSIDRGLRIIEVYGGSPARRAGLRPGDEITEVDGRPTKGESTSEVTERIRGPEGTAVTLTFTSGRAREERTRRVRREQVDLPIVQSEMRTVDGEKIAVASLASFTSGAHGKLGSDIRRLLSRGAKGVVLDLRGNGGGLLDEAVLISSIFIPEGTIVSTRGRSKPRQVYTATGGAIDGDVPVVVLVDENSASASEIVTGALQDRDRATVVGTRTYGKGVFQEVKRLSNGGALDITVGEYYTPSGRNLGGGGVKQGSGIEPDVRSEDDRDTRRDEALDRALEVVGSSPPS